MEVTAVAHAQGAEMPAVQRDDDVSAEAFCQHSN